MEFRFRAAAAGAGRRNAGGEAALAAMCRVDGGGAIGGGIPNPGSATEDEGLTTSSESSERSSSDTGSASSSSPSAERGAEPAAAAAAVDPGAEPGGPCTLGDGTEMWQTFKFTTVFDVAGAPAGWECRCQLPSHAETGRGRCNRTLRFSRHGGRALTERKLKLWCQQAFACEGRAEHMELPVPREDVPSLAELAAWSPPADHLLAVERLEARRALRFPGASSSAAPAASGPL